MCDSCATIAELDVEIEATKEKLARLFRKRFNLKTERNIKHDSFTCLPTEVISRIFAICLPEEPYPLVRWGYPNPLFEELPIALLLRSVSTQWRQISESTPQLWTYIKIRIDDSNSVESAKRFRQWLSRSGNLPVSIRIYMKASIDLDSEPLPDSLTRPLINVVNKVSHRWGMLEVHMPEVLITRLCGNGSSTTTLHSLGLTPSEWTLGGRVSTRFSMKNVLPTPSSIGLRSLHLDSMDVDWTNLLYIEGFGFRLDECLLVVQRCPRLLRCSFEGVDRRATIRRHDRVHIVHNFIRWLWLEDWGNIADFFDNVSFPSLVYLEFMASNLSSRPLEVVTSFIRRSGCSLGTLRISDGDLQEAPIIPLLEATPQLRTLDLFNIKLSDTLFCHLGETVSGVYNGEDTAFLPDLNSIYLHGALTFSWPSVAAIYTPCDTDDSSSVHQRECSLKIVSSEYRTPIRFIDDENSAVFRELIQEDGVGLSIVDSSHRNIIKDLE
ncbi:unnamed protein product [Cyclocybe aegerita]|uniref:F-box domain-containing protein n=1 Tax=Cyclocybe aegerita TaxID=1973307 RepID=A0A8S0VUN2_CYCAE|nr:unnamed protein product [Cyclocybe aegerita]